MTCSNWSADATVVTTATAALVEKCCGGTEDPGTECKWNRSSLPST
ncbi:hypothetical protein I314_06346 [Cryptococcus bacillisporus CA1873]|uniref:Uncharacterized protein n=1 Tax=Cryptococcus bacillisporus CA1873 TaxID=1296111 RepID=A0ABR5B2N3_CRYGA|nr:hypothetical protein I314_06346 [Cryptococcus bacillisporus CA1873]|eukprot:KIR57841.1 hypothetical protein I314_06346 [Cryptococcus gattii CA1873]